MAVMGMEKLGLASNDIPKAALPSWLLCSTETYCVL
jgi:hypothetical protein